MRFSSTLTPAIVGLKQKPTSTSFYARGKIALVRAVVPLVASANNLDGLGSFFGRDAVHNILNEPPPADLHGRLKFTVEKFVDAADIAGKTVLDIGCGYGWFELWAAKQAVKKITGLSMTPADLKTASANIRRPRVSCQEGGATALPIQAACSRPMVAWEGT